MSGTAGFLSKKSERGIGKITFLVFGTLIAAALFTAYQVLPFYYYFYDLENQFQQIIKVASLDSDKEIREKLLYFITKYEIPARPDDLKIERIGRHMRISLKYKEVFYVTWRGKDYDLKVFDFHVYAEGDF